MEVRNQISSSRTVPLALVGGAVIVCFMFFAGGDSGLARAAAGRPCYFCEDTFFVPNSVYQSFGGTSFPGAPLPIELSSLQLVGPASAAESQPLPPLGSSVQVMSAVNAVTKIIPAPGAPPETTARYTADSAICTAAKVGVWDTELTSLDLTGDFPSQNGPVPYIIRESPTLASIGQHTVEPQSDGSFLVSSFFDVFTELSLDGGQSFAPASGPLHLELTGFVPEPASIVLAMVGLIGGAMVVRRQRPRWRSAS